MANPFHDFDIFRKHVEQHLLVADLKEILRESKKPHRVKLTSVHMSTSGNKKPLIDRIVHQLHQYKVANDIPMYNSTKAKIQAVHPLPLANRQANRPPPPVFNPTIPYQQVNQIYRPPVYNASSPYTAQLRVKESPFFSIKEQISKVVYLPSASRNAVTISFVLTPRQHELLKQDPLHHKVAIVCGDNATAYGRPLLLEFPNPAELEINSKKIQANLKGMKNKPGTIGPVDITPHIDRTLQLANRVVIHYSSGNDTHKKFSLQVVLLQVVSVDDLVKQVKDGRTFPKEQVLEKLQKPDDDDIQLASFDMTLKDALSYMRITVPCRTIHCKHQQCFDAFSFLTINEQTPQWTCPICHVSIQALKDIAVDGYFQDILENVSPDVDTVLIDPQGNWTITGDEKAMETEPKIEEPMQVLDLDETEDEDEDVKRRVIPSHLQEDSRASTPSKRKPVPVTIDLTEDSEEDVPMKRVKQSDSLDPNTPMLYDRPTVPTSAHAYPTDYVQAPWPPLPHVDPVVLPELAVRKTPERDAVPAAASDGTMNIDEFQALYESTRDTTNPLLHSNGHLEDARDQFPFDSDDISEGNDY